MTQMYLWLNPKGLYKLRLYFYFFFILTFRPYGLIKIFKLDTAFIKIFKLDTDVNKGY